MVRLGLGVALAMAFGLAGPAVTGAATLSNSGGTLTYAADAGRTNVVAFDETAPGTVVVDRRVGDDDPFGTVTGCALVTPGVQYACSGVARLVADGGSGDDSLDAGGTTAGLTNASASIAGGDGDDTLFTGGGSDALSGGPGDDRQVGGAGADAFSGGAGVDFVGYGGAVALAVTIDGAANDGASGEGDNVLSDVEDVGAATAVNATVALTGSDAGNKLTVTAGLGTLVGLGGSDELTGGPQDDTINARDGYADRVKCGGGNDTVVADMLDTVSQDCENVDVAVVAGGADDAVPTIAWVAPNAGEKLSANAGAMLQADASDDRGVAMVQFFDDDRLVCEDPTAPYACAYQPRGGDVGRNTLIAVAVDGHRQTASAPRPVRVRRFEVRSLSLSLRPRRDAISPYSFQGSGRLRLPTPLTHNACKGTVTVTVKAGARTIATRRARLRRNCRFSTRVTLLSRPAADLRFTARFGGNRVLGARSARSRAARAGRRAAG